MENWIDHWRSGISLKRYDMTMPDWYQWDAEEKQLYFFGRPATLFWQDPSLITILKPLKEELGDAYFFLLVAYSASQGTEEDYHQMVNDLGEDFSDGLQRWGDITATAGWGHIIQSVVDYESQSGTVIIENPWELTLFPETRTSYAMPFMCGKLSGLFTHCFSRPMRARVNLVERHTDYRRAVIQIEPSESTLRSELQQLARQEGFTREQKLQFLNKQLQQKAIELETANRRLQELATRDDLTGLYNRRHFMELAQREFNVCRRYLYPSSLVMFDIDLFKLINDRYGHQAGDKVLKEMAVACKSILRKTDICGRIGGEEFLILLPHTDLSGARMIAERLSTLLSQLCIDYDGHVLQITISAGVSQINTDDELLDHWIKRVDDLLYQAKHQGRNQVICTETAKE